MTPTPKPTATPTKPACPLCGRRKGVVKLADTFKCGGCGALFDDDVSEGGSHYTDPTKRLEMEDEQRARKINRLGRR